jgi:hypothetical protein
VELLRLKPFVACPAGEEGLLGNNDTRTRLGIYLLVDHPQARWQLRPLIEGDSAIYPKDHHMEIWLHRVERDFARLGRQFELALESFEDIGGPPLLRHASVGEVGDNVDPCGAVEIEPLCLQLDVVWHRDELCLSCVGIVRPGKPANKLKRNLQRLVRMVNRGDLQLGEINPFAHHVDANDAIEASRT